MGGMTSEEICVKKRVLILGGTGMLGHTLFAHLSSHTDLDVYATVRTANGLSQWFAPDLLTKIQVGVDANDFDTIIHAFARTLPDIVINCIGLIKQLPIADDPVAAITINSLLPHRISMTCSSVGARMIHISTDCVFDGEKGNYTEGDCSNANDLYGRSKFLGEVAYPPHCLTLRTSIVGHELKGNLGLIEWFLSQEGRIRGFTNAIYSGFPTIEIARIITDYILPRPELAGVYHASSDPISKYDLLKLVAGKYGKNIEIEPYDDLRLDHSLNSSAFRRLTGYVPRSWPELVDKMYQDFISTL